MNATAHRDIYLSLFLLTVDLHPGDPEYTRTLVGHLKELRALGYRGFDLPIHPGPAQDLRTEVDRYAELRRALERAGLDDIGVTTNVASTATFDPTSPYAEQRQLALDYLKSRIDITAALGGHLMAGPLVFPYNVFPTTDAGQPIWSNALQDWLGPRYRAAAPILDQAGEYAAQRGVRLAIEPVDHWETPAPNMVEDVLGFLADVPSRSVGVCVDSAHVLLGSSGPEVFEQQVRAAAEAGRLNYVQVSAPDRGAVRDSWIPWEAFLGGVLPRYDGPLLIEIFNAIPAFWSSLRLTRPTFWIPGQDEPDPHRPNAYTVAAEAIETLEKHLSTLHWRDHDEH